MRGLAARELAAASAIALLLGVSDSGAGGPAPLGDRQQELRRVQQQLQVERHRLQVARRRERRLADEVQHLDRAREATEARLDRLEAERRRAEVRAAAAAAAVARAEMGLARRRALLGSRLRDLHRYGRAGYLDVVLGAATFSEFVTRARVVGAVVRTDARFIAGYQHDRDRAEALRAQLEAEQARLAALMEETRQRRRLLTEQIEAKRRVLESVAQERAAVERVVEDLRRESAELEALIRRLQAGGPSRMAVGAFIWPLRGAITSRFGFRRHPIFRARLFHQGVDIAAPYGAPVRAAGDGTVLFAGWYGGYGKLVVLDHGDGLSTLYGHLSAILVAPGAPVTRGQILGRVGSTGYSTGPHLHFEFRRNGRPVDPGR
ncbi:MAG: peptidoglycan DD-metalloendopeptidase family protein [Armatimonadota bacterium]|nr:peptidoglycan DD-metalloendopeptidase family protein [Armatimonadota bacterium]MDR7532841.1 peptidoglycan DD-metalloendopeptidase family protein [Armatimonadota bacterium]MDR7535155.1 peptidoglycan DD-metalloendopeptidase family protein [Armatimonadota bacterium]